MSALNKGPLVSMRVQSTALEDDYYDDDSHNDNDDQCESCVEEDVDNEGECSSEEDDPAADKISEEEESPMNMAVLSRGAVINSINPPECCSQTCQLLSG